MHERSSDRQAQRLKEIKEMLPCLTQSAPKRLVDLWYRNKERLVSFEHLLLQPSSRAQHFRVTRRADGSTFHFFSFWSFYVVLLLKDGSQAAIAASWASADGVAPNATECIVLPSFVSVSDIQIIIGVVWRALREKGSFVQAHKNSNKASCRKYKQ